MHKSRTFVAHVDPSHQKRHRGTRHTDRKSHRRDQNRSRGDRFVELFDLYPSSGTNPKLHHRGKIRNAENFPHFFYIILYFFWKKKSSSKLLFAKNFFRFLLLFFYILLHAKRTNVTSLEPNQIESSWTRRIFSGKTRFRAPRTITGSLACRKIARRTT